MRVILASLAFAIPASAQDVADFGGTGCVLRPVTSQDHVAEIICRNVETTGNAWSEGAMSAGGLTVGLGDAAAGGHSGSVTVRRTPASITRLQLSQRWNRSCVGGVQ